MEVIRRDTEIRIDTLGAALRRAESADSIAAAFFSTFEQTLTEQRGYVYMVSELFVAGRHSPELQSELGALYSRARREFAEILRQKERHGIIRLRFDAEAVLAYLFAAGDGASVQQLTDPTLDSEAALQTSYEVARFLIGDPSHTDAGN